MTWGHFFVHLQSQLQSSWRPACDPTHLCLKEHMDLCDRHGPLRIWGLTWAFLGSGGIDMGLWGSGGIDMGLLGIWGDRHRPLGDLGGRHGPLGIWG